MPDDGSITASGGWMTPIGTTYQFGSENYGKELFASPHDESCPLWSKHGFTVARGGVQFGQPATFPRPICTCGYQERVEAAAEAGRVRLAELALAVEDRVERMSDQHVRRLLTERLIAEETENYDG